MTLALSIRQPWASLILLAGKDIENRNRSTAVRGPILIHAAKGMTRQEYVDAMEFALAIDTGNDDFLMNSPRFDFDRLPRGGIIGSVILADCARRGGAVSPWFQGPYGFVLRDPKPLDFIPFKGQLGFFDVPGVEP